MSTLSRRRFVQLLDSGALATVVGWKQDGPAPLFRFRTITAGVEMGSAADLRSLGVARDFLRLAKTRFAESLEVQTTRIATQPLPRYVPSWMSASGLEAIREFDRLATDAGVALSVGPVLTDHEAVPGFASWTADLVQSTASTSFSSFIVSPEE